MSVKKRNNEGNAQGKNPPEEMKLVHQQRSKNWNSETGKKKRSNWKYTLFFLH